jgi:TPR repeat protein
MFFLGVMYSLGQSVAQDHGKARELYQKAADAGNAVAMNHLGWLYRMAGVSPKITAGHASGTKEPPTPATRHGRNRYLSLDHSGSKQMAPITIS